MSITREELRSYLDEVCRKRGVPNFFDRFEEAEIDSGGVRLQLEVIEVDRARPTVVFMPGTNAYALLYGEFLVALADQGYNVVGFDPRGHGRSGGARGSYVMPELVSDLRAAVGYARKRFGDPIFVAGSSQGGITSFYFAAAGDSIAGAICHNVADLGDPTSVELTRYPGLSRLLKPLAKPFARLLPEFKVPINLYLDLKSESIRGLGSADQVLREDPLCVTFIRLRGMASLGSEKLPRPIEEIKTPIMIIHAGDDKVFPLSYIERIYNRLTCDKTLKVYPGLSHFLIVDNLPQVLPNVIEWLSRITGSEK